MFNINICQEADFRNVAFPLKATHQAATESDVKKVLKKNRGKGTWAFVWQRNSSVLHDIVDLGEKVRA